MFYSLKRGFVSGWGPQLKQAAFPSSLAAARYVTREEELVPFQRGEQQGSARFSPWRATGVPCEWCWLTAGAPVGSPD